MLVPERKSTKKGSAGVVPAQTAPVCRACNDRLTANAEADKGKADDPGYVVK